MNSCLSYSKQDPPPPPLHLNCRVRVAGHNFSNQISRKLGMIPVREVETSGAVSCGPC